MWEAVLSVDAASVRGGFRLGQSECCKSSSEFSVQCKLKIYHGWVCGVYAGVYMRVCACACIVCVSELDLRG